MGCNEGFMLNIPQTKKGATEFDWIEVKQKLGGAGGGLAMARMQRGDTRDAGVTRTDT